MGKKAVGLAIISDRIRRESVPFFDGLIAQIKSKRRKPMENPKKDQRIADEAREEILALLNRRTAPDVMTKAEALDVLEELFADLEGRCEALKNEIEEENNGDT